MTRKAMAESTIAKIVLMIISVVLVSSLLFKYLPDAVNKILAYIGIVSVGEECPAPETELSKADFQKAVGEAAMYTWNTGKPCVLDVTVNDEIVEDDNEHKNEISDPILDASTKVKGLMGDDCLFTLEPMKGTEFKGDNALVFLKKDSLDWPGCKKMVAGKTAVAAVVGSAVAILGALPAAAAGATIGTGSILWATAAKSATVFGIGVGGGGTILANFAGSAHTWDTVIVATKVNICKDMLGPNYVSLARTGKQDPDLEKICTRSLAIPTMFCNEKYNTWVDICSKLPIPKEIPCSFNDFWKNRCKELGKAETDKLDASKITWGYISSDEFLIYKLAICFEVFNSEVNYKERVFPCFAEYYTVELKKPVPLTQFYSRIGEELGKGETTKTYQANNLEACDWPEGGVIESLLETRASCVFTEVDGKRLGKNEQIQPAYYTIQISYRDELGPIAKNDMVVVMTTTIEKIFGLKPTT